MKCLVTGGAGFIGSNLVDKLINEGHDVVVIDDMSTGKDKNINPKVEFFRRDISEMNNFSMFQGVDIVFHLAALARVQPSIENPIEYHNVNVNGTLNVLKACVDYDVKRFIFSSSSIFATFSVIFSTVSLSCRFAGFLASSHLNSARYCSVGTPSTVNITCGANASLLLLLFSLLSSRLCRMDSLAMCSPIS